MRESLLHRDLRRKYPVVARGEGAWLYDESGKKYLDAAGGAAVVTIGHGVRPVTLAIGRQARKVAFVHSSQFTTASAQKLARLIRSLAPGHLRESGRVFFTSGGSEATETAIKLVRQYWLERGEPKRFKILSRWSSYHGATLGALALSGNQRRREAFLPLLVEQGHIAPCYCYRCPFGLEFPACELKCAHELTRMIEEQGPESVAAFILEPIVGATNGAVPPEGYLETIRQICNRHGILLIADEVMTGMGRTGKNFAVDHWSVVPDIILLGKGLASGYAPLGGVLASGEICRALEKGSGLFRHGFTYSAHPVAVAAGLAVQRWVAKNCLLDQCAQQGDYLAKRLEELRRFPIVGDVRGKGLLQTVEFVQDRATRRPFPPEARVIERLDEELREAGVSAYPMKGCADGIAGDHFLLAPPYVISREEIDFLLDGLAGVIESAQASLHPGA
jgi:adenosylmethionine-8-amino-7-oxononanoate aminotransferase